MQRQHLALIPTAARRALLRTTTNPLFHGTRYMSHILAQDELSVNALEHSLSLTRCPDAAASHANNGPRDWDDGCGAIIVLDGDRLRTQYRVTPWSDAAWIHQRECEEYLDQTITPLSRFAVGYIGLADLAPQLGVYEPRRPRGEPHIPVPPGPALRLRRLAAETKVLLIDRGAAEDDSRLVDDLLTGLVPGRIPRLPIGQWRLLAVDPMVAA